MKRIIHPFVVVGLLLGAVPAAVAAPQPPEKAIEEHDPVGQTIAAEAKALSTLLERAQEIAITGVLEIPPEHRADWNRGVSGWAEVVRLTEAHQYGPAFKKARGTRKYFRDSLREIFASTGAKQLQAELKAWIATALERQKALQAQQENYAVGIDTREHYFMAEALIEDAAKYHKGKKYERAFRSLDEGLREADFVVIDAYPSSR